MSWRLPLILSVAVLTVSPGCGDDDAAPRPDAAPQPDAAPTIDATPLGQGPGDLPIDPRLQGFADQVEAERVANAVPGVAALIMEDGQVTFAHGFGTLRSGGNGGAVNASTLFRIGSVTKMMTAAVLLQDVAAGRVTLDTPITDVIPDFALGDPTWAPSMHVRHLLSHSSAIVDYTPIDVPLSQWQDAALSSYLTGEFEGIGYLMAPSGRMWNYSNPNFALAGLAIERLGGGGGAPVAYREAMHDRLFAPLGMTRTTFLAGDAIADGDVAWGRSAWQGLPADVAPDDYDVAWMRPAGFAWSTVWDLSKFVGFLLDGDPTVLADAERSAMQSPQIGMETFLDLESYGFGLIIDDGFFLYSTYYDTRLVSHGGDLPGYAASIYYLPGARFAVMTLASADGAHFVESAAWALANLAPLPAPATPPDLTVDPATFDALTGNYRDDFNVGDIMVTRVGNELRIALPDVAAAGVSYNAILMPLSPGNFLLTIDGTQIVLTFLLDGGGQREYLRARPFVGHAVSAMPRRPHAVDAIALRRVLHETPRPPAVQWIRAAQ